MPMTTLLYLEDDEALAFVTKRALERRGYAVTHCATLASANECISSHSFACALLDLKIGKESSLDFIAALKQRQDIPIVLVTGYGSIQTAVQAMKLGAINYLTKPCSIVDIVKALAEMPATDLGADTIVIAAPSLAQLEWEAIQKALAENAGNISATARQLKMHRRTLQRKLDKKATMFN
jgi:two-component system response regulator RegA